MDGLATKCAAKHCAKRELWRQQWQCKRLLPGDYKDGYIQAYVDIADGGDGQVPPVPPPKYWNAHYRTVAGQNCANQWFEGYRSGAASASVRLNALKRVVSSHDWQAEEYGGQCGPVGNNSPMSWQPPPMQTYPLPEAPFAEPSAPLAADPAAYPPSNVMSPANLGWNAGFMTPRPQSPVISPGQTAVPHAGMHPLLNQPVPSYGPPPTPIMPANPSAADPARRQIHESSPFGAAPYSIAPGAGLPGGADPITPGYSRPGEPSSSPYPLSPYSTEPVLPIGPGSAGTPVPGHSPQNFRANETPSGHSPFGIGP